MKSAPHFLGGFTASEKTSVAKISVLSNFSVLPPSDKPFFTEVITGRVQLFRIFAPSFVKPSTLA